MNKKDKLLTLSDGSRYVIIDQCEYNGRWYYFANKIIDDNVSNIFKIFSININANNEETLENITNDDIIKAVCSILDKKSK